MIKSILSLGLLLISAGLAFKHGWEALHFNHHPGQANMMEELGISGKFVPALGIFTLLVGVLLLIPQTYFIGNLLQAVSILTIMSMALRTGNVKVALIEIPFLVMPLVMILLKYPFKN